MSTGHGHEHTPLTPDERDLAQRLARLDAGAQPSAALDAGILAAARAAASGAAGGGGGGIPRPGRGVVQGRRRRPRLGWAAGAGLAASMVLAVGVAWQLRPLPDTAVEYSEAPAAAPAPARAPVAAEAAPARTQAASPPGAAAPADGAPEEPVPAVAAAGQAEAEQAPAAMREVAPAPPPPPAPPAPVREAPPVVFDAPAPVDAPAPPPAPVDLPSRRAAARQEYKSSAPAEAAQAARRDRPDLDRIEVTGSRLRDAQGVAAAAPAAVDADPAAEADAAATSEPWFDQPLDDAPPASADSPEVREAWLGRIRELVAEERYDEARASLGEFHRRYPDVAIPQDLRVLLPE